MIFENYYYVAMVTLHIALSQVTLQRPLLTVGASSTSAALYYFVSKHGFIVLCTRNRERAILFTVAREHLLQRECLRY